MCRVAPRWFDNVIMQELLVLNKFVKENSTKSKLNILRGKLLILLETLDE
jgi:hypothetical protein